ncbi:lamin tail domain-containing protein [Halosimplex salinum]|uniref:lamin tail domain-containing protein n=1 Tax=Halosimplex salinum TaxID=1710538 RepID=UPI000F490EE2|nr:lamin tail domain-containing protein [Halosimplex salinum]
MSQNDDSGAWRTTRDHEEIQEWAVERDAVPVDRGASQPDIAFEREPADAMPWSRFFGIFDSEDLVFRYRPDADEVGPNHEVVSQDASGDTGAASVETRRSRTADSEHLGQSDTGESEPATHDEAGSEDESAGNAGAAQRTTTADQARGPTAAADQLVLDSVHEHRPGLGDSQDEHVALENAGDEPLDLSGWRLRNGDGRTFEFPPATTLDPGNSLRVHSGEGRDEEADYWGADGVVWEGRGETVIVETPDGRRVLEADYKSGSSDAP